MGRGKKQGSGHALPLARQSALAAPTVPRDEPSVVAAVVDSFKDEAIPLSDARVRLTPADVAKHLAASEAIRPMQSSFEKDKEAWKKSEREFTRKAAKELHELMQRFASSDEGWRAFLKIYARAPHYSMSNMLWAWAQLERKEVRPEGMVLSESGWRALGRTLKPGFKRSYQEGEDGQPSWDDTYAAEMMAPLVVRDKKKEDESPEPGAPKTKVIGFRVFDVYHEDATESKDGSELPKPSWYGSSGSEEDAAKLWQDVERLAEWQGLEIVMEERPRHDLNRPVLVSGQASYERSRKQLKVTKTDRLADQATAALGALMEHFGPQEAAKSDDESKARIVARESAKYAVASLYGLHSERQSFPFLAALAGEDRAVKRVSDDVHKRVSAVLNFLDPVLRMKARGEEEMQAKYGESRAKKRKTQKGRSRKSALAE